MKRISSHPRLTAILLTIGFTTTACGGGMRPTLVEPPSSAPLSPLELELPEAPLDVAPLPPSPVDFPLESSVDDALLAWALDRGLPYVDNCARATLEPGQLCDAPTERDTVRLVGPSADEPWYVVTVTEVESFDLGTGYRVSRIDIAGR